MGAIKWVAQRGGEPAAVWRAGAGGVQRSVQHRRGRRIRGRQRCGSRTTIPIILVARRPALNPCSGLFRSVRTGGTAALGSPVEHGLRSGGLRHAVGHRNGAQQTPVARRLSCWFRWEASPAPEVIIPLWDYYLCRPTRPLRACASINRQQRQRHRSRPRCLRPLSLQGTPAAANSRQASHR